MSQYNRKWSAEVTTIYQRIGGKEFFVELVRRFYDRVTEDPLLRPLYPEDLQPAKARLAGFLAQYWGGPPEYSQERGHPRLRQRHMSFRIGQQERDAWVAHMAAAVDSMDIPCYEVAALKDYFERTATLMINQSQ